MGSGLTAIGQAAPAIAMVAVFALVIGGITLVRRGAQNRQKGILMLVCAAVVLANVLIWTI
ncbi:hypothetical protein [Stakelama marina]|uniref:Uncharacterized protein n=1 Tax=Stakelama marina TaxID=2826939 RepID=A0A8T4IHZ2_9SPHN|nr:hypothetical protein [Stakelama marina]MBR0551919.1 hypothetical protein [Stakelama marina]